MCASTSFLPSRPTLCPRSCLLLLLHQRIKSLRISDGIPSRYARRIFVLASLRPPSPSPSPSPFPFLGCCLSRRYIELEYEELSSLALDSTRDVPNEMVDALLLCLTMRRPQVGFVTNYVLQAIISNAKNYQNDITEALSLVHAQLEKKQCSTYFLVYRVAPLCCLVELDLASYQLTLYDSGNHFPLVFL